jgi:hypothetical protein
MFWKKRKKDDIGTINIKVSKVEYDKVKPITINITNRIQTSTQLGESIRRGFVVEVEEASFKEHVLHGDTVRLTMGKDMKGGK